MQSPPIKQPLAGAARLSISQHAKPSHQITISRSSTVLQGHALGRAADSRVVGRQVGMAAVPRHVVPDGKALLPLPCPVCCCYQAAVRDDVALLSLLYHRVVHLQVCNIGQIAATAIVVLLLLVCQDSVHLQV